MREQILVVEDDPNIRDTLQDILQDEGYEVRTLDHGRAAMAVMAHTVPNLVIMDLFMPLMNGWDLLAAMRAEERLASVPVVVITSAPGQAPPGVVVLPKPPAIDVLLQAIRSALGPRP